MGPTFSNHLSLLTGVFLTVASRIYVYGIAGSEMFPLVFFSIGIPVAYVFLMFETPKPSKGIDLGIVVAMPICIAIWPLLALALVLGKPWKEKRWRERKLKKEAEPIDAKNGIDDAAA